MAAEEMAPDATGIVATDDTDLGWWRVLAEPAVVAILLATVAHVARRNVTDIVVFLGMAGVIAVDRAGPYADRSRLELPAVRTRTLLAAAICYGLVVLPLVRGGIAMRLVLALPGIAALVVVLRNQTPRPVARAPGRGWVVWSVLLVFGCLFELANFLMQPDSMTPNHAHPVLSDIVEPWLGSGPTRAVFCAVWVLVGWRLVRILVGPAEDGS